MAQSICLRNSCQDISTVLGRCRLLLRRSCGITLQAAAGGCYVPDCADCEAGSYSVKGIDVNAALGTAEGMSTFEGIKSVGSSVCGMALRGAPSKGTALEVTALGAAAWGGWP
jgi:hypothetical protein